MKIKTTISEAYEIFKVYNEKFNLDYNDVKTDVPELYADITYKSENFTKEYSEAERTYRVTNRSGKRFFNMPSGSRSVFGNSLDGSDFNVRLDYYNWEVEKVVLDVSEEVTKRITCCNIPEALLKEKELDVFLMIVLYYGYYAPYNEETLSDFVERIKLK